MQMPKSKYEQTKVCDETLVKEMTSVQDIFSIVSDVVFLYSGQKCILFLKEDLEHISMVTVLFQFS